MATILIVDDDEDVSSAFRQFVTDEGHTPLVASNAADAIRAVETSRPDVVFMDVRMPGTDGLTALRRIRELVPDACVVIMTAYGTSQTSIEAMQLGAYEYLTKPLDLDVVRDVIGRALEARRLSRQAPAAAAGEPYAMVNLVGSSAPMQAAYKLIGRLTTNDVPVLLVGEKGVGKELVARTIHFNSHRRERPLVSVGCRALPDEALARELFGDDGAGGAAEAAAGGTLFVDDIDAMSLALQARLLRVVRERRVDRGRGASRAVDVRVIAATAEDLEEEVRQGTFNETLHDALRTITVALPPLRERREDIPELVAYFLRRFAAELGKPLRGVDPRAMQVLVDLPWPGNVGQLETALKRACVLARGEVLTADDLGESLAAGGGPARDDGEAPLRATVREALRARLADKERGAGWSPFHDVVGKVEEVLVREALALTGGNQVKAAEILGLNRTTLRKKMRLYDL
jgi:DNA-binding NtrC family response regulator